MYDARQLHCIGNIFDTKNINTIGFGPELIFAINLSRFNVYKCRVVKKNFRKRR